MKGLITAAGKGTRSGLDGKFRKEMLPMYDIRGGKLVLRPIIDLIINRMKENHIHEIGVVLSPEDSITKAYLSREFPEIQLIFQDEPLGYGNAVGLARDFIDGDMFILNAGDGVILNKELYSRMVTEGQNGNVNILTGFKTDSPRSYGNIEFSREGEIIGVVEKPDSPRSDVALCASYVFEPGLFEEFDLEKNSGELTPSINNLITHRRKFKFYLVPRDEWISVGVAEKYARTIQTSLEYCNRLIKAQR
jgi:glucose-1-phosphate thymidylyltransferase